MVWAITVKFRPYLYGGPTFTCRVDHNPLVYLHQQRNLTGRLARWHMKLMEYNFTVVHRAGRTHSNVDPLSRHPHDDPPPTDWDDLPEYASFPTCELPPTEAPTVLTIEQSRRARARAHAIRTTASVSTVRDPDTSTRRAQRARARSKERPLCRRSI